jgi:lysophospholipase L1-like esterase
MRLVSRNAPAFASSQLYPASNADDGDYGTVWRGSIPGWLAYDLSRVPAARRRRVLVAWYNDPVTSPYDHTVVGEAAYNSLRDYTVEANAAPGGSAAPTTGWVALVTVKDNRYHSREHVVDFVGYNWLRMQVTAGDGSPGNSDAAFNLDVHDASGGVSDSWLFLGDSVTQDGLHHRPESGAPNFSQLVAQRTRGYFPAYEDGGIYGLTSSDGARRIQSWLATFPGRFVALSYGLNDANACVRPATFRANYVAMVKAVLAAGKVPVVPMITWARAPNVGRCAPGLNRTISALYHAYPQIVRGPDLWTYFRRRPALISSDGLHPTGAGYAAYRREWATAMLATVYRR